MPLLDPERLFDRDENDFIKVGNRKPMTTPTEQDREAARKCADIPSTMRFDKNTILYEEDGSWVMFEAIAQAIATARAEERERCARIALQGLRDDIAERVVALMRSNKK